MGEISEKAVPEFKERLLKRREALRWAVHNALVESQREDYAVLAGQVHDSSEESVAALLNGMNLTLLNREVQEIADIEAALERIKAGTYGICVDCGDDIVRERLEAYPTAKRCITCQTRRETARSGGTDYTPSL
jgi:RNA polymerase-binding protein DksA